MYFLGVSKQVDEAHHQRYQAIWEIVPWNIIKEIDADAANDFISAKMLNRYQCQWHKLKLCLTAKDNMGSHSCFCYQVCMLYAHRIAPLWSGLTAGYHICPIECCKGRGKWQKLVIVEFMGGLLSTKLITSKAIMEYLLESQKTWQVILLLVGVYLQWVTKRNSLFYLGRWAIIH